MTDSPDENYQICLKSLKALLWDETAVKELKMRFNEKELVFLSRQPSERAAELGMRGPKKGDGKSHDLLS